ncbi:Ribonuclease BN [Rubellimicrobium mesophilum DSM 19309]|uniref:Ribonuclease BN n=1 Tax=Rubellimicrobium mesophilum DSM 19309 TaxID=442562 RepID=A0A017HBL8_9RHOB|nr:YihY/virulence factor BrkB family protein [Rubellimicrobium mesophilum]EYD71523.1 Ribonuclease BN [Rubellimicrobium mesophilum DSM 19309]
MALASKWRDLARTAAAGWWNDRAMSLGAAISFFTLFSLAPMLLAVISVAGLVYGREAAQGAIVGELGGLLGEEVATAIEALIASASDFGSGVIGTTIGVVLFLILTTSAFVEIQDDLNVIWKVRPASTGLVGLVRTRLLSLSVVAGIGFLLLVSLVIDAGVAAVGTYLETRVSGGLVLVQLINSTASFLFATLLFAMIFKVLPAVTLTWRDVWTGAVVTGVLFTAGKVLIGVYIGRSGVASAYGAAASVITIMLWIYYSSLILLFGAEFTKAYAETHGSRA